MRKSLNLFYILLLAAAGVLGCQSTMREQSQTPVLPEDHSSPAENNNPTDNPQAEAEQKILYWADAPGEFNPDPLFAYTSLDAQLYTAFHEGLVTYHPFYLSPLPGVARTWEISRDKKVYKFYLRDNAYFNNGDRVTAADFKNSWLRIIKPENNAEYSVYFDIIKGVPDYRNGLATDPDQIGIRVINDQILEIKLEKPANHFLKLLCHMTFVPVHPDYLAKENWGDQPSLVTNGPYNYFRKSATGIILLKNNLYWNAGHVAIPQINILLSDDAEEITNRFNQGKLHWTSYFNINQIEDQDYLSYFPSFSLKFYFFKTNNPPWDDSRLRRGLSLLLPWSEIRPDSELFFADSILPAIPGYSKQQGITENHEEGLALLAEAGYPGGKGLPPLVIKFTAGGEDKELAELMRKTWQQKLNLEVIFQEIDSTRYFRELKQDDYTLGTMIWIGDYADPLSMLQMWTSYSNLNDAHYKNQTFDEIIDRAMGMDDEAARYQELARAEKILLDEAVVLPVRQHPCLNLVNDDLFSGWFPNLLDIHPFMYFRFREYEMLPGLVFQSGKKAAAKLF